MRLRGVGQGRDDAETLQRSHTPPLACRTRSFESTKHRTFCDRPFRRFERFFSFVFDMSPEGVRSGGTLRRYTGVKWDDLSDTGRMRRSGTSTHLMVPYRCRRPSFVLTIYSRIGMTTYRLSSTPASLTMVLLLLFSRFNNTSSEEKVFSMSSR